MKTNYNAALAGRRRGIDPRYEPVPLTDDDLAPSIQAVLLSDYEEDDRNAKQNLASCSHRRLNSDLIWGLCTLMMGMLLIVYWTTP